MYIKARGKGLKYSETKDQNRIFRDECFRSNDCTVSGDFYGIYNQSCLHENFE